MHHHHTLSYTDLIRSDTIKSISRGGSKSQEHSVFNLHSAEYRKHGEGNGTVDSSCNSAVDWQMCESEKSQPPKGHWRKSTTQLVKTNSYPKEISNSHTEKQQKQLNSPTDHNNLLIHLRGGGTDAIGDRKKSPSLEMQDAKAITMGEQLKEHIRGIFHTKRNERRKMKGIKIPIPTDNMQKQDEKNDRSNAAGMQAQITPMASEGTKKRVRFMETGKTSQSLVPPGPVSHGESTLEGPKSVAAQQKSYCTQDSATADPTTSLRATSKGIIVRI